jgi:hypothetical protein
VSPPPPTADGPPGSRPGWAGWAIAATVFFVGFTFFPLRTVGAGFDHLPGDLIDSRFNNYVLEHGYRWLTGPEPSFWDVGMFYPARRVTAYSDAHLGTLPVYAAFRAAGLSPESAYQGWFLVPFALNFGSCHWAIRRFGWGPVPAAAGAYLFAFGLPLATQLLQHAQLGPRFLVPPALVLGWEWAWSPTRRRLGWLAACVAGQAYLTLYVGYFLGLMLLVQWTAVGVLYRRSLPWGELLRPGWPTWAGRFAVAAAVVAALLPLLVPYFLAGQEHGYYPPETIRALSPNPRSWATPADLAWQRDWAATDRPADPDFPAEKQLFPGLVPLAALLAGVFGFARRPVVLTSAAVVLLTVALTTRVGGYALYDPLLYLPGVPGMRAVGRVVLVLLFPLAVLVAALTGELMRLAGRLGNGAAVACGVTVLGLLVADQWLVRQDGLRGGEWAAYRFPKAAAVDRRERLGEVIRRHPNPRLVYVFPDPNADEVGTLVRQLDAMWASQQLGVPAVNGYSGYWPPGWVVFIDYAGLFRWLKGHGLTDEEMAGLVLVGEPSGGDDPGFEWAMRSRFPPLPDR